MKSAHLCVTGYGVYEIWLNGQRVGDKAFTLDHTAYDKRMQYHQVYGITALLQKGDDVLGDIMGDGWYRSNVYINSNRNVYGTRLGLLA